MKSTISTVSLLFSLPVLCSAFAPGSKPASSTVRLSSENEEPASSTVRLSSENEEPASSTARLFSENEQPASSTARLSSENEQPSSSTVLLSFENELGAIDPVGYWDPVGLAEGADQEKFNKLRAGEIKNGRAAMLAVIGYIVPEFYRFPGELAPGLAFKDIPNGVAAIEVIPSMFWIVTFFAIGAADFLNSDSAGYIETLPIELDDETMQTRRNNEISNGRLAMLAFWELVRHDLSRGVDGLGDHLIAGMPFLYGSN